MFFLGLAIGLVVGLLAPRFWPLLKKLVGSKLDSAQASLEEKISQK